ncbi:MAG: L,D-transpeptidase family protein [Alphaproteobacteria bacterium]
MMVRLELSRVVLWLAGFVLFAGAANAAPGVYPDLVGALARHQAAAGETMVEIARRYGLGFVELVAANPGVDPWLPDGQEIVLPTAHLLPDVTHEGIVVNLGDQRLYFFPPWPGPVQSYPISIGKDHNQTPVGMTSVVGKREQPTWIPPASIRAEKPGLPAVVPPGPANPLGAFSLDLGLPSYRIHGTPFPYSIGRRATHGCIRLYPEDIAALFPQVTVGLPVALVDQPVKLGWFGGDLFLEIHPSQAQADELELDQRFTPAPIEGLLARVGQSAGDQISRVDWAAVARIAEQRRGVPVPITR